MLHNLPQQYRKDPWILAMVGAMAGIIDAQCGDGESIIDQMSLDTVSWNLPVEERVAGLTPAASAALDDRRSELKAKWRSGGKVTLAQIQAVADAWKNGETEVTFTSGQIRIKFSGAYGVPTDIENLKKAIALVIPAHLSVDYQYKFLLIREIHDTMTLDVLQTQPLTKFAF